ncbi:MAG: Uma2 family endonuclease [Clostridiales bacterium]|jgi:Uma2 family endonuclease|nr:Uma2 family endonuclease [Clostridiales bacterium]
MEGVINKRDCLYEILDGKKVWMHASPNIHHTEIATNIVSIFKNYLRGKTCKVYAAPTDVRFSDDDMTIPDLLVLCDRSKNNGKIIVGAPDLIVEVLSPSTAINDYGYKKDLYEKHGVGEYWIVHPNERFILVFVLENGKYKSSGVYEHFTKEQLDVMTDKEKQEIPLSFSPSLFADLEISLDEVFEDIY